MDKLAFKILQILRRERLFFSARRRFVRLFRLIGGLDFLQEFDGALIGFGFGRKIGVNVHDGLIFFERLRPFVHILIAILYGCFPSLFIPFLDDVLDGNEQTGSIVQHIWTKRQIFSVSFDGMQ